MAEILHMITTGTTDLSRLPKEHMQLEFCHDLEALERLPSPRVFNTHLYMAHLPEQVVEKKVKVRNTLTIPYAERIITFCL